VGKYKVKKRDGGKWNWTNRGGGRSPAMGLVGLAECPLGERVFSWKGKGSPYSIAERRVPELIPVLAVSLQVTLSHKPGGRLPLLSTRAVVTLATLPFPLLGEQRHDGCEQFA